MAFLHIRLAWNGLTLMLTMLFHKCLPPRGSILHHPVLFSRPFSSLSLTALRCSAFWLHVCGLQVGTHFASHKTDRSPVGILILSLGVCPWVLCTKEPLSTAFSRRALKGLFAMTSSTCNWRSYPEEELLNLCKMSLTPSPTDSVRLSL